MSEANVGKQPAQPRRQPPAAAPDQPQQHRYQEQPDERGVEQDRDPEDHAHLLRWQWAREGEGEEHGDHHGCRREHDTSGMSHSTDHRLPCIVTAVPVLLCAREQEHRVVHRDREDHRKEEHRCPGIEEALRLEAEQAGEVAVLKDQRSGAERGPDREQVAAFIVLNQCAPSPLEW